MKQIASLFLLLFWATFVFGQRDGIPSFSAADVSEFDTVNLSTLTPTFNFPAVSKNAGVLPGSIGLESPQSCRILGSGNFTQWSCGLGQGSLASIYAVPQEMTGMSLSYSSVMNGGCTIFTIAGLVGVDGLSSYPFPTGTTVSYPPSCTHNTATATTTDGSGYTATFTATTANFVNLTQVINPAGWIDTENYPYSTLTDPFGNTLTFANNTGTGKFTDTLGAVTSLSPMGGNPLTPSQISYTDTSGNTQNITLTQGTASTFQPTGTAACARASNGGSVTPITSINYPDGTSMGIGWQTNNGGLSGLINSITLRTGATISYTYGTPITNCIVWAYTSLSRTTPDGTKTYSASTTNGVTTTTVLDAGMNKSVYTLIGGSSSAPGAIVSTVYRYQNTGTVANPQYLLLSNIKYCYNNDNTCALVPNSPITQRDTYSYMGNGSLQMSHRVETYDTTYGVVLTDAVTDNITSPNQTITKTIVYGTWNGSACVALGNTHIHNTPCTITTTVGGTQLSKKTFTYNSNGAPTSVTTWISSTDSLTTNYTPNGNGTMGTVQAPNGQSTTITYGNCNSLLPTATSTTVNGVTLTTGKTWNCNAGVIVNSTDYNSNESFFTFDAMNRPKSMEDPLTFTLNNSFTSTSTEASWSISNPSASSNTFTYVDGLERLINTQTSHGSNYDTVSNTYGYNGPDWQIQTSEPCSKISTGATQTCSSFAHTTLKDPLGRIEKTSTTNNETINYGYSGNDVQVTLTPAPNGENVKSVITESDGFGRTTSVCNVLGGMGSTCHQLSGGNHNGIFTTYSYSFGTGSSTVAVTRGSQTHTTVSDATGRVTSETYPESGTTTYVYDSRPAAYCKGGDPAYSSPGNLVSTVDANGNKVCMNYDGLNRLTDVWTNQDNGGTQVATHTKRFRYDSTNNCLTPSYCTNAGVGNVAGRMVEADVTSFGGPPYTAFVQEIFGYDADGRLNILSTDSINSGGFNALTASYYLNGVLHTLGNIPGNSYGGYTVSLDSNGYPITGNWAGPNGGNNVVSSVTYDSGGRPTTIKTNGTSGDKDLYVYDSQTGNMTGFSFIVGSPGFVSTLGWNANGTLNSLGITDQFNSGGSQSCSYGYDDLARLTSANCGTPFNDTYSYDQYNNLTQSGTLSWNPGYSSTSNQYSTSANYDSNGNVTYDGVNTYTWDAYNQLIAVNSGNSAAACGNQNNPTSGSCLLKDAFGRVVEQNQSSGNLHWYHLPAGGVLDTGSNGSGLRLPAPGGGMILAFGATGSNIQSIEYLHHDWEGTSRLSTSVPQQSADMDTAFAPYGQSYDSFNSANIPCCSTFDGMRQDTFTGLFDTPNRELMQNAGRWISPDPCKGCGWNAYAYPPDPNTHTDPSGLCPMCGTLLGLGEVPGAQLPDAPTPEIVDLTSGCPNGTPCVTLETVALNPSWKDLMNKIKFYMQNGLQDTLNAPYVPIFWQKGTKVNVVFRGNFAPGLYTTADLLMRGINQVTEINEVNYDVHYTDGRPYLTHGNVLDVEWGDANVMTVLNNGAVALDSAHTDGNDWLKFATITLNPSVEGFKPSDITGLGKFEELHNNGFGDCWVCEVGTYFDIHSGTRYNVGVIPWESKLAYWINELYFSGKIAGKEPPQ